MKMNTVVFGLIAGLVMLIAGTVVGMVLSYAFPAMAAEYNNPALFRPWSDPLMSLYYAVPFATGLILAWLWINLKDKIKEKDPVKKGVFFGLVYWIITIPGMAMSYSSFPISLVMTLSWSISIMAQAICAGLIFSKLFK
jgi:hypothetical protein